MELVLTDEPTPVLCLNMIVKNESHIIKNTLINLLKKVKFGYWVISDTGSTDNTKELITEFFKEEGIPGELYNDEWKDFGHNRTIALAHAFGKSKYLMVFDADDEICGDFVLPELTKDSYHFQFGDANGTSYTRTQIVNNKKKWKYVGVLHEIITSVEDTNGMDIITGNYYTVSGKSGDRSRDVNKYLKDALVLEKAYEDAIKNNDDIYNRYGFYCANSYYDCGKHEDAIKWYKKTLDNKSWSQEKYVSCLRIFNCYNALNQKETGMFYLVKSSEYDKERTECFYELISYYCCNGLYEIAYGYYTVLKPFFNDKYLITGLNNKLFLDSSKSTLYLPYYMILVADKVHDYDTGIQMFRIIFTKKHKEHSKFFIGNMLYNLQFFIERVKPDEINEFNKLFKDYVDFLISINYPICDHEFMGKYEKYGIKNPQFSEPVFSLEECSKSKNILIYSGYAPSKWNNSFSVNNALGGSETAISCLSKFFPKEYNVYVAGEVDEEKFDNITYVNLQNLSNLIKTTAFHTIIVSRYLNFYEIYKNFSAYQTFIWGHDIALYQYGSYLSAESILTKWSSKITGCVCQTEWHKNHFLASYPQLKDKITVINNGINTELFINSNPKKVSNKFIYTSCSERGLLRLIRLWPTILENLPDAELTISSYNNFPNSEEDNEILEYIQKTPSITHVGKLNRTELYNLMSTAEYWLYPSYFQETSCITSLELLASDVICLYYPVAGLVNTIGDYGIPISEGNEIDTLLNLSIKQKSELKKRGKEYALSCSWKNRTVEWMKLLFLYNDSLNITNITNDKNQLSKIEKRMFDLYESLSMPEAHTEILKKISETFTPNVIYDIGASTLHWTKAAKNIWPNSEFCAFDAIEEAEKLYQSKNIKYNIGVISDQDNKIVKFYENKENPAGNSYYKEIGHPNSVNVYPENSYIEKKAMTLETVVKRNNFLLPDIVKIDVQGAEFDILKGGQTIINNAKYLIIELQNVEYNRGAPLENVTIDYLQSNGWEIVEAKFSNNGPDADYLFINTNHTNILDYTTKIINLKRREDRKKSMASKLSEQNITKYDFFEAVDGKLLEPSPNIKNLVKNNDFNYRKGVIGCALSHYTIWNNLINDNKNSYYVILEDDIKLTPNFNILLDKCISIIKSQNIEYALIGGYQIKEEICSDDNIVFSKITEPICSGAFGYIISKKACIKLVNYLNKNGINRAIDHSDLYTNCIDMYRINKYLVTTRAYQIHGETDTDIQLDYNCLNFDSIPTHTVSFVDWWREEYCGGSFDNHNNYFTNLLRDYCDVQIVEPNQNPDILFYSVFGNDHLTLNAGRKVFYSGESISQDIMADFNITFDENSEKNCRLPLWVCYLNDDIIDDYTNKINYNVIAPKKSRFCSLISQQDNVSNTRSEIVYKLSKYKRVDCGGKFLNNIGYIVPRGINCSGKIEHNNNYKFAITFENKDYPGYVTEKIVDAYKSKCIPIYWGHHDVIKDFNPSTFINANNFASLDELVEYIIKVDNDDKLYKTFFKEPIFSNKWVETFNDQNKTFYKNLTDRIIGKSINLFDTYFLNEDEIINNDINVKTYSQASQDIFVINLLQHKQNGYFVEIGTNDPIVGNNTYLLEKDYGFKGLLVEYEKSYETSYKEHRPNSIYVINDARKINYKKILDDNKFPQNIDYLQIYLDVDNKSTLDTLLLLNNTVFDSYKFATITFEHDYYRGDFFNTRQISREIFKNRGYLLVCPDVCTDQGCVGTGWQPFEDWYIHPDLVNMEFVNAIKSEKEARHDFIKHNIINNYTNYVSRQQKMKIIFSNNCSVGDIYFSQPFIKNIVTNNTDYDFYIYHQTSSYYFTDILNIKDVNKIPELKEKLFTIFDFKIDVHNLVNIDNMSTYKYRYDKTNNILLICTWLGCLRQEYNTMHECNMISYNETYKLLTNDINKQLNFSLKYDDNISLEIYPCVPTLNIYKYRDFKQNNKNSKIIFYYNFLPSSGQKFPVKNNDEHNRIISKLAEHNIVVITNKQSYTCNTTNIYFADDFLDDVEYYDAKNFYYHAQMANESDYSIYFDLGRGFMSMNKTFIEENNSNIRLHISNNEYYFNALNDNMIVPDNYMTLVKVENYFDIIVELQKIILDNNTANSDTFKNNSS